MNKHLHFDDRPFPCGRTGLDDEKTRSRGSPDPVDSCNRPGSPGELVYNSGSPELRFLW
jgi:hypothetical protein